MNERGVPDPHAVRLPSRSLDRQHRPSSPGSRHDLPCLRLASSGAWAWASCRDRAPRRVGSTPQPLRGNVGSPGRGQTPSGLSQPAPHPGSGPEAEAGPGPRTPGSRPRGRLSCDHSQHTGRPSWGPDLAGGPVGQEGDPEPKKLSCFCISERPQRQRLPLALALLSIAQSPAECRREPDAPPPPTAPRLAAQRDPNSTRAESGGQLARLLPRGSRTRGPQDRVQGAFRLLCAPLPPCPGAHVPPSSLWDAVSGQ